MADCVEKSETTPVEKEVCEKPAAEDSVDEDSKASENGDAKLKENGDKVTEDETSKDGENGDSTDGVEACPVKRKSVAGDAPEGTPAEGASPEKKAKLDETKETTTESNGEEAKAAA